MTPSDFPSDIRMTPQRVAVLDAVRRGEGHLTAAEINEIVREQHPSISFGTVYRTLHLLAEHGLILEFPFGDEASRFDARTDEHDHVRCVACGELADVEVPQAILAHHVAAERSGYQIESHQTIFLGLCPRCQHERVVQEGSGESA